jgi:hypothetical protein
VTARVSARSSFLFIALPVLAVLYALAVNAYYVGFFNDDAFFILGSKSLRHGAFLNLSRPGHPPLLSYMPGTSILLLPVTLFSSQSLISYQVWSLLISVFAMGIAGLFFENILDPIFWPAALLLSAINPLMLSLSATVLSDVPYLLITLLFFLALFHWEKELTSQRIALLAITAIAAFYVRPLGAIIIVLFSTYI